MGNPHHDFLAYITYNPVAEEQTVADWQYIEGYEGGCDANEMEKMRREACEMDVNRSA